MAGNSPVCRNSVSAKRVARDLPIKGSFVNVNLTFVDCPNVPVGFKIVGTIYLLLGMMTAVVAFLSSVAETRPPVASVTFRQKEKTPWTSKTLP